MYAPDRKILCRQLGKVTMPRAVKIIRQCLSFLYACICRLEENDLRKLREKIRKKISSSFALVVLSDSPCLTFFIVIYFYLLPHSLIL